MPPKLLQMNVTDPKQATLRVWVARLLVGVISGFSLQAAVSFLLFPGDFTYAYELSGAAGEAVVRGAGVLFFVWNVPYVFAALDPARYRAGLYFAVLMQSLALLGGIYVLAALPSGSGILASTLIRFILFAALGLILLVAAYLLVKSALPYLYAGLNGRTGGRSL